MARNDDGFNLDDMLEIFGDTMPPPPRAAAPAQAQAPAVAPPPAAGEELTPDEQALLKAYEQRKQAERLRKEEDARAQALQEIRQREERRIIEEFEKAQAAAAPRPLVDVSTEENEAFCAMLEETRSLTFAFLVPLTGIKAANNMLNKSVEKARDKAPVILKDANWRMDGTLREDGSVDPERLLKNAAGLPAEIRLDEYLAGLQALVGLRLRAVEAGLGAPACAQLKEKILAVRPALVARPIAAAWVEAFYGRVLA